MPNGGTNAPLWMVVTVQKGENDRAIMAAEQGDYRGYRAQHEENLVFLRGLGDRQAIATALENLGSVAYDQGACLSPRAPRGKPDDRAGQEGRA
jgi:hypothetical protein